VSRTGARARRERAWVAFRTRVLDALDAIDAARFAYIDRDRFVHVCPSCRAAAPAYLSIRFLGESANVDIDCWHPDGFAYRAGCTGEQIQAALSRVIEVAA
jgi:hypothetical protein